MEIAVSSSRSEEIGYFFNYLDDWSEALPDASLTELIDEAGGPDCIGIFCVDMCNGFCTLGPLASDRIEAIISPVVSLFKLAFSKGVMNFTLTHDSHDPAATEFIDYPPHCIRGTKESDIVPELLELPFSHLYNIFPKNSLSSSIGTGLDSWLKSHPEITRQVVVGDCTDLCTYQLAMHLKLTANAANLPCQVILPKDCVDTYDIPVEMAKSAGIPAHPAEILHSVFLYNMACNGVRVVSQIY